MAKTKANEDIDDFIASIDPNSMRDARYIRNITAARQALDDARENLRLAVEAARRAGDSWTMIGLALRTSKQNAFRKYGRKQRAESARAQRLAVVVDRLEQPWRVRGHFGDRVTPGWYRWVHRLPSLDSH